MLTALSNDGKEQIQKAVTTNTSLCLVDGFGRAGVIRRASREISIQRWARKDVSLADGRVLDEMLGLYRQVLARNEDVNPVIQVTGVEGGEGATTVAALLASVVVDLERCGVLLLSDHEFGGADKVGLASESVQAREEEWSAEDTASSGTVGMFVCSAKASGRAARSFNAPNASPIDLAGRIDSLVRLMRPLFHLMLIDSGPALGPMDALRTCRSADGVILVVEAERTKARDARRAIKRISGAGGRILGVVLNRERPLAPRFLSV